MTSQPPHDLPEQDAPRQDPLVALWQTAAKPDTHNLVAETQRLDRLHKRFHRSLLAILCGLAVLFLFEEATGRLETHGVISVAWIAVVTGVLWRNRARCRRVDAMSLDTVSLLKAMIARAKGDLRLARCLYAGTPAGALAGAIGMKFLIKFAGVGAKTGSRAGPLQFVQTGVGLAALVIMVATGLVLARARARQVSDLSEKLKSIEGDL